MHLIFGITVVLFILFILYIVFIHKEPQSIQQTISFVTTFNTTKLPIIKLKSKDTEISFLIDTGAQASYIDSNLLSNIEAHKIPGIEGSVVGINSPELNTNYYKVILSYKGNSLSPIEMQAFNFDEAMANSRKSTGIYIGGILGGDFLSKNNYVIDYTNYTLYTK